MISSVHCAMQANLNTQMESRYEHMRWEPAKDKITIEERKINETSFRTLGTYTRECDSELFSNLTEYIVGSAQLIITKFWVHNFTTNIPLKHPNFVHNINRVMKCQKQRSQSPYIPRYNILALSENPPPVTEVVSLQPRIWSLWMSGCRFR